MTLHTITITDDEMDALCEAVSPMSPSGYTIRLRGLLARLVEGLGLSTESRALILATARGNERVEFHSPAWHISIWLAEGVDDAESDAVWAGNGTSLGQEVHQTVRNVSGATPDAVLDQILAFHAARSAALAGRPEVTS